jgi:hypothetical protein
MLFLRKYIVLVMYSVVTDEFYRYKTNNINGAPHYILLYFCEFYRIMRTYKIKVLGNIDQ